MKKSLLIAMVAVVSSFAANANADPLIVGADDTMEKILIAQQGKRVTLKFGNSVELTGTVKTVTPQVVHLSELGGKEFFDAAIATKSITAILVRTRN